VHRIIRFDNVIGDPAANTSYSVVDDVLPAESVESHAAPETKCTYSPVAAGRQAITPSEAITAADGTAG